MIDEVESSTTPGQTYTVQVEDGKSVCDCPGFRFHGHCKHTDKYGMDLIMSQEAPSDEAQENELGLVPVGAAPATLGQRTPTREEMALITDIARSVIAAEGMVPKGMTTHQALAVMLRGWELGVGPMASLRHIHAINGRTEPDAALLASLAAKAGYTTEYPVYGPDAVTCVLHRPDGKPDLTVTYTREMAVKSGQVGKGGPWQQYPTDMLAWAATKRALKLGASEVLT